MEWDMLGIKVKKKKKKDIRAVCSVVSSYAAMRMVAGSRPVLVIA